MELDAFDLLTANLSNTVATALLAVRFMNSECLFPTATQRENARHRNFSQGNIQNIGSAVTDEERNKQPGGRKHTRPRESATIALRSGRCSQRVPHGMVSRKKRPTTTLRVLHAQTTTILWAAHTVIPRTRLIYAYDATKRHSTRLHTGDGSSGKNGSTKRIVCTGCDAIQPMQTMNRPRRVSKTETSCTSEHKQQMDGTPCAKLLQEKQA